MESEPVTVPGEAEVRTPEVVAKPWGEELLVAHNGRYAGKVLILNKGHRLSLQYHERKHETQYVESGRIKYTLGSRDRPGDYRELTAGPGTVIELPPGAVHRMEALEDARIFEVSTPELDDVVRLDDDYGREGTSAP